MTRATALDGRLLVALLCACWAGVACTGGDEPASADGRSASSVGEAASRCYRSDGPILSRLASGPPGSETGAWIRIDEPRNAGGGPATIVEDGGASLDARWARRGDTLVLEGANDFLQISARVLEADGRLRGEARIFSDAQLERAPSGELAAAERRWDLVAESAPCGDAPRPWSAVGPVTFDPGTLTPGDTVGPFRADSVAAGWADAVGEWTGSVRFVGAVWLSGSTIRHFDHPEVDAVCFEADRESAPLLPRWPADERRPWFCFENDSTARRLLQAPDTVGPAEVLIDRFTSVRAFTDAVNTARLVDARRPAASGRPMARTDTLPAAVVQRFVDAANARDARSMAALVAADAVFARFPDGRVIARGRDDIHAHYARLLSTNSPAFRITVQQRIVERRLVIDQEQFTGAPGEEGRATWIYEVSGGLIQRAWDLD